jgi:hypothetical protein
MAQDLIRYDLLAQDALRGLVRKVLMDAAKFGLPGEHHFYISFDTRAPGVRISQRLREKYPDEMTIVLQHQFWDLLVTEHTFEVGLSFGSVPERLLVPFTAIKGFFDPSVQFGLQFEVVGQEQSTEKDTGVDSGPVAPARSDDRRALRGARSEPAELPPAEKAASARVSLEKTGKQAKESDKADEEKPPAEIVSLDSFRKK